MTTGAFLQADLDFAAFIATAAARQTPAMLRHSAWTDPPVAAAERAYDQETERQRAFIHNNERRTA
ncbi:MAG: hypothetical protein ACRDT9_00135 [Agromyces sp.]